MPGFQSGNQNNGFVYTQPVYFAFADNYDSTITTDFFQKRGARVGVDFRYKARKHSGFELNLESIRDAVWLQSRVDRRYFALLLP
jgi:lipopolysaccharide assembly outer membrane protein LptD (OstA)